MVPQTKYARSGDINIAYQVFGAGAVDLVVVPGWVSSIDMFWEEPSFTRFLQRLGSFSRVILFDKRGTGLSDRVTATPMLEERMDDVRAVMDAVGSKRAALLGYSEGGPMCILFAVTYPERTEALITVGSFPRIAWAPDYPFGAATDAIAPGATRGYTSVESSKQRRCTRLAATRRRVLRSPQHDAFDPCLPCRR